MRRDNTDLMFENPHSVYTLIATDANRFGIMISYKNYEERDCVPGIGLTVTIIFNSVEDLNLYKLVGKYEEAPYLAFTHNGGIV